MLSPDKFFGQYDSDFPAETRNEALKLFRRAVRDYYVMRRTYVIDPESGRRAQSVVKGEVIQQQKSQRRIVKRLFTGYSSAGRPKRLEIKPLVARLFILWGQYASTPATFSWKTGTGKQTNFEAFLMDLLPRLGAPDVRRYVEDHWRKRK
jgi:hypothetical protein